MMLARVLRRVIRTGALTVIPERGESFEVGDGGPPRVTIRVGSRLNRDLLFKSPALAIGEAYMDGVLTVEDGEIYDFLDLASANMAVNGELWGTRAWRRLAMLARRLMQYNPIPRARRNVAHHYDLSDTLYELFLDRERQYSCAYFASPEDTIDKAQERKMRHIAAKLLLEPGKRVLDIGSGWGGLGLYLARHVPGAEVTGCTLSVEQHRYAQQRATDEGLADRVRFELRDYREIDASYDRIVSVGMFEHVGVGHYDQFFGKLRNLLSDDGVCLLHTIGRADGPGVTNPWIRKYIFPGGYSPALSEIMAAVERQRLFVTDIEVLRLHYAHTLRAWRCRFLANRDKIVKLYDERFCRMWEFYLAGSEVAFRHMGHVVFQLQLTRRQDAVPLTRDYIFDRERNGLIADGRAAA